MKITFYFIVIIFFLTGCDNSVDFNEQYDYTIEQQMVCSCPQGGVWLKLFVEQDTVSKAIRVSDNQIIPYEEYRFHKSIKDLFNQIAQIDTSTYEMQITMDPSNTYPSYLYYNPKPIVNGDTVLVIVDADISYLTRNYIKLN